MLTARLDSRFVAVRLYENLPSSPRVLLSSVDMTVPGVSGSAATYCAPRSAPPFRTTPHPTAAPGLRVKNPTPLNPIARPPQCPHRWNQRRQARHATVR